MNLENLFLLLGLDPDERNPATIQVQIQKMRLEWSKLAGGASPKAHIAKAGLQMIAQMERILVRQEDPAELQRQSDEAKRYLNGQEKEQFAQLDEIIRHLHIKGYVTEEELQRLERKFPQLTQEFIRKRVNLPLKNPTANAPTKKQTDSSTLKQINDDLRILGKGNLYEFLDLARSSSLATLSQAAQGKWQESQRNTNKTVQVEAAARVAGHCLKIFKEGESRAAYDHSMSLVGLEKLKQGPLEFASTDGVILAATYDSLVKEAMASGVAREDAEHFLREFAKQRKWSIEVPAKLSADSLKPCGACGFVNGASAKHCGNCGFTLEIVCPQCSQTAGSETKVCAGCGFSLGDMPNALRLWRQAQRHLAENNFSAAKPLLVQAIVFWPRHPQIGKALEEVKAFEAQVDQFKRTFHDAMRLRRFYTARTIGEKITGLTGSDPDVAAAMPSVERQLQAAEHWVEIAKNAKTPDDSMEAYFKALDEADDCPAAVEMIAKTPSEPPAQIEGKAQGKVVSLRWQPAKSRGRISYRVLRKCGAIPKDAEDGESRNEVVNCLFEDTETEAGNAYYYSVYSVRGGKPSVQPAICGPLMTVVEIGNVLAVPGDGSVALSWQIPKNAAHCEAYRAVGQIPKARGDGEKVAGVRRDGFGDNGLKNGVVYGYLIVTAFKDIRGNLVFSEGVGVTVEPVPIPEAIKDLHWGKSGGNIWLEWTPSKCGSVQLFSSSQPVRSSCGDLLAADSLELLGKAVPIVGKNKTTIALQGSLFITPVIVSGTLAVVGQSVEVTSIDAISNVTGAVDDGVIRLRWIWPTGAESVRILYRYDRYPEGSADEKALACDFSKGEYDADGAFILKQPEPRNHYFAIHIIARAQTRTLYSEGSRWSCCLEEPRNLFYQIVVRRSIFGKPLSADLHLQLSKAIQELPELALIKKARNVPISPTEGTVVCRIQARVVKEPSELVFPLADDHLAPETYARLFLIDAAQNRQFRIITPTRERAKLF